MQQQEQQEEDTNTEFVQLDTSSMNINEKVEYLVNLTTYLLNKRPKQNPQWTEEECDASCAFTSTPVPGNYLKLVTADDGNQYHVHPGIAEMMRDNNVDIFPMEWMEQIDPVYLEIPKRKRGRKPGTNVIKHKHVPVDMSNWNINDVPNMNRQELMQACSAIGITTLLKAKGASFVHEDTEWMRSAVIAHMNQEEYLPAFSSDQNASIGQVPIHQEQPKKAPPRMPAKPGTITPAAAKTAEVKTTTVRPFNFGKKTLQR